MQHSLCSHSLKLWFVSEQEKKASFKLSHLGFISTAWKTSQSIQLSLINWQEHWGICEVDCSLLCAGDDKVIAHALLPWWKPKWFDPAAGLLLWFTPHSLEVSSPYQRKICTVSTARRSLAVINSVLKQLPIDLMCVPHSYLNQLDSRQPLITAGTLEDRSKGGLLLLATIKDHKSKEVDGRL